MKKLQFHFLLIVLFFSFSHSLWAQSETLPESQTELSSESSAALGEAFFYFKELKSDEESVHALAGDKVNFCVKLNSSYPKISTYMPYLQQIELELLSEGTVPLKGSTKLQIKGLKPNAAGCYEGSVSIPKKISAGKYQLAELDLVLSRKRHVSLREELGDLLKIPVIEVEAAPVLPNPFVFEKIISKTPLQKKIKTFGRRARGEIQFRLVTHDANKSLDANSLKVFFKLYLDGARADILQSKCRSILKGTYFDCKLYVSRAVPDLKGRLMELKLDALSIEDAYGNLFEMTEEKDLMGLFDGKLLHYVFYTGELPSEVILPVESRDSRP